MVSREQSKEEKDKIDEDNYLRSSRTPNSEDYHTNVLRDNIATNNKWETNNFSEQSFNYEPQHNYEPKQTQNQVYGSIGSNIGMGNYRSSD